jgi:hypothetical protein
MSRLTDDLARMAGVWLDHLVAYHPDGSPMTHDPHGTSPGPFPYDNLVYIDFDGERYTQTNVTFRGRPMHVRSFRAGVVDGVLRFETLGPNDPGHVGVSGGRGLIWFVPQRNDIEALTRYSEPDHIRLLSDDQRTRATTLYRHGELVRIMTVSGVRLAERADERIGWDPRGAAGDVHEVRSTTTVFAEESR